MPRVSRGSVAERPDLIESLLKAPGAFYVDQHGRTPKKPVPPHPTAYLKELAGLRVLEVTGGVDSETVAELLADGLGLRQGASS